MIWIYIVKYVILVKTMRSKHEDNQMQEEIKLMNQQIKQMEKKNESRACLTGIWRTMVSSFLSFKLVYEADYGPSSLMASPTYCIPGRP